MTRSARWRRSLFRTRWLTRPLSLAVIAVLGVLLAAPGDQPSALAQSAGWIATFDGKPSAPLQFDPPTWDVQVHSRNVNTWKHLEPMQAHHGTNCAGFPATHQVSEYNQAVFQCNEHVMTSIKADEGYGLVVLTPNQMVDFSQGEAVIRFDMSTFRASWRDWVSIWLSPFDDQIPMPLMDWLPDLTGEPRRGVHITMTGNEGTMFRGYTLKDFVGTDITTDDWLKYEDLLTTSAVRRDPFELRISRTSVKFGLPQYNKWWVDKTIPDLGWDRAVLQFAHHSYTPWKGCMNGNCDANTWHWDNVNISNAVPFTMIKGDQPFVDATTTRTVKFPSPAPVSSFLRFSGVGTNLQVSFDGGQVWQTAQLHPTEQLPEDHFKPYWMPVPTGTTRVDFRGQTWYGGNWIVRGPTIWSQTVDGAPTLTPTPTATVPPTLTPPPTATVPPTPTAGPSLPPPTSNCTTRPRTTLRTQALGEGRLQVTVEAGRPGTAPSNIVRKVQITRAENAQVEILGQTIGPAGGSAAPTTANQALTFVVARQPANAQVSVTIPLVITDDCGEWSTFVGGGPHSF
jgi:hypothetical protein